MAGLEWPGLVWLRELVPFVVEEALMPWKRPEDMSDEDVRIALAYTVARLQDQEVTIAALTAMVLAAHEEIEQPNDAEYEDTVDALKEFLAQATRHLGQWNDAQQQLQAERHSRN